MAAARSIVLSMSNLFVQLIADWMVFAIVAIAGVALLIGVPHKHKIAVYSRILIAGLVAYWLAKVMEQCTSQAICGRLS